MIFSQASTHKLVLVQNLPMKTQLIIPTESKRLVKRSGNGTKQSTPRLPSGQAKPEVLLELI